MLAEIDPPRRPSSAGRVAPSQRYTRSRPCPVCASYDGAKHDCWGYITENGRGAFCTRAEFSGGLSLRSNGAYLHMLDRLCECGVAHGGAPTVQWDHWKRPSAEPAPIKRTHLDKPPDAIHAAYENPRVRKLRYGSGKSKYLVWQHDAGDGDWVNGLDGQSPGLYGAASLAEADPFEPLAIPEGEKDADKLGALGWRAVISSPDGKRWDDAYSHHATGRQVVIFTDRDADGGGMARAEKIAASIAPYALSVRVVLFEEAHDVGDWIDAGGTLDELRQIAAATPIITASTPETGNSSFTPQDDPSGEAPRSCCAQWRERALKAEATLNELHRERAIETRILALPNEKLAAPVKLAALSVGRSLRDDPHTQRDEEGRPRVFRAAIARRCGVKEKAVSGYIKQLDAAGLFTRTEKRSLDDTALYIGEGPNRSALNVDAIPTPPRGNAWGGYRPRVCHACGGVDLETRVLCRDCGAVLSVEDTNRPETVNSSLTPQDDTAEAPAEGETLDMSSSATTVGALADMNESSIWPACPECGGHETDGIAHEDGPHCDRCDIPLVPRSS